MREPEGNVAEISIPTMRLSSSLHEQIVNLLRDMIVQGKLIPGERIAEPLLCKKLGVSRTPLREALKVLAAEQLVELLPNRGAIIARVSVEETAELFEVMGGLETVIGERIVKRATGAEFEELENIHAEILRCRRLENREQYTRVNVGFHSRLSTIAGNQALSIIYRDCQLRIARVRHLANLSETNWDEAVAEHETIMTAMRRRDGRELGNALRTHRMKTSERFLQLLRTSGVIEDRFNSY